MNNTTYIDFNKLNNGYTLIEGMKNNNFVNNNSLAELKKKRSLM